jgi:L,D-peptidoglycan transpeptidase YkuD (ErfK/YbiS/YcfS/YnhG family)
MKALDLTVHPDGRAEFETRDVRCAIGRAGRSPQKQEGDGATPIGAFLCREVYWRPDRLSQPQTALPCRALTPSIGWCDDPVDAAYNRPVALPYQARAEQLWRDDGMYDLIVPLGWNDELVIPGAGSAIFLHIARPDFSPTEGCVALALSDLLDFLALAGPGSRVIIKP